VGRLPFSETDPAGVWALSAVNRSR